MKWLTMKSWSPYVIGTGIGLLSWFTFLTVDTPIGVSTTFVRTVATAEKAVAPDYVAQTPYLTKHGPKVDWQALLVLGVFIGAFLSAWGSGAWNKEKVPALWQRRFGPSPARRYAGAFIGGFLVLFGARLADGCTSGHGISGSLQLALSSWTFFIALFIGGVATAFALFGKERSHV